MSRSAINYLYWPFLITAIGLTLAFTLGWATTGTISGTMPYLLVGIILCVLEISLSFDNAIVNANKLHQMSPVWQQRFLTII